VGAFGGHSPSQPVLRTGKEQQGRGAISIDRTDGLSMDFGAWRFNLRSSNTEPLLRLNVEARGDAGLMQQKTAELAAMITM